MSALLLGVALFQAKSIAVLRCENRPAIARVLGSNFRIADSDAASVVVWTGEDWLKPMASLDAFVPATRASIGQLQHHYAHAKIFVLIPEALPPGIASLVRQASREAGASVITPSSESAPTVQSRLVLSVYDAVMSGKSAHGKWTLLSFSSQEPEEGTAAMAIDGDPETYWHTQYNGTTPKPPHEVIVDTGTVAEIGGFTYLPRQDGGANGTAKDFEFAWSLDGKSWEVARGVDKRGGLARVSLALARPVTMRYFRFRILTTLNGGPWGSAAELDVLPAVAAGTGLL